MKKIHGGDIYRYDRNMIDFSANINPLGLSKKIKNAIIQNIDSVINYPDIECSELISSIATFENVKEENIVCGNGAGDIIFNIVLALKPKKALIVQPTFAEYENALNSIECEKEFYFLQEEKEFQISSDLLDYINPDVDMIFVCNPNNPTGKCIKKDFVLEIIKKARVCNAFLVIDECFMDFVENFEKYSTIEYIYEYQNFMILKAFTKMYAIAGLRLGYAICGDNDVIQKIYQIRQPWNVSSIAQTAGIAALSDRDIPKKTRLYIKEEREFLLSQLKQLGFKTFGSKANYILFKSDIDLTALLLDYDIIIRDCKNYRGLSKGFFRIAVKTHNDNEKFIISIKKILEKYNENR